MSCGAPNPEAERRFARGLAAYEAERRRGSVPPPAVPTLPPPSDGGVGDRRSPQERGRCCCPAWSTARDCITARYGRNEDDERCECRCHYEDDDDDQ